MVPILAVLAFTGRAEAQVVQIGNDREQGLNWFDSDDGRKLMVMVWTMGVHETLHLLVSMTGCESAPVSGRTLAFATADLLRQDSTARPLNATVIAYAKLSGCAEKLYRALGSLAGQ